MNLPVAIVTGATGGIGSAVVRDLTQDHTVYAIGRNQERLDQLAKLDNVVPVKADIVAELCEGPVIGLGQVLALQKVDVLIHAAAISPRRSVAEASVEDFRSQLDLNVIAPAQLTRLALPALRKARGTVVFINSGAGHGAHPGNTVYATSKHALYGVADGLRKEEAHAGVRVSTVAPGPTDTAMLRGSMAEIGQEYTPEHYIRPEDIAAGVRLAVNAGESAQVSDVSIRPRIELADRQ